MLVTMWKADDATSSALDLPADRADVAIFRITSSRANFMCRDSSTTWMLLIVRTKGATRSSRIQSRCMTSRTSSATRMAA